ncbi:MAG: beta-ketoacyl-ACP synthase III [Candidatus Firestonebacteria bacterium]
MSKTITAKITGVGFYAPEKILTNKDLEKMVDTSDEWIKTRTGMSERHIADEKTATSDLATKAALKAIEMAKITPEEIDVIIVGTVSPDKLFPSTACIVQNNIKASKAAAFDLSAACSGFIYGLTVARGLIATKEAKTILVIGADCLSKLTDWTDRNTCILFGDGAGAAILQATEEDTGLLSSYIFSDATKADLLQVPAGGTRVPFSEEVLKNRSNFIKMEGNEVFKNAVKGMERAIDTALLKVGLKYEDVSLVIPHQANIRIIESIAKRMKLPAEKVFINLDKYGNTSSASIPIAITEAYEQGRLKKGDILVITAFGAGLTMGAAVIRWSI